jgi:hypothetical protein
MYLFVSGVLSALAHSLPGAAAVVNLEPSTDYCSG